MVSIRSSEKQLSGIGPIACAFSSAPISAAHHGDDETAAGESFASVWVGAAVDRADFGCCTRIATGLACARWVG